MGKNPNVRNVSAARGNEIKDRQKKLIQAGLLKEGAVKSGAWGPGQQLLWEKYIRSQMKEKNAKYDLSKIKRRRDGSYVDAKGQVIGKMDDKGLSKDVSDALKEAGYNEHEIGAMNSNMKAGNIFQDLEHGWRAFDQKTGWTRTASWEEAKQREAENIKALGENKARLNNGVYEYNDGSNWRPYNAHNDAVNRGLLSEKKEKETQQVKKPEEKKPEEKSWLDKLGERWNYAWNHQVQLPTVMPGVSGGYNPYMAEEAAQEAHLGATEGQYKMRAGDFAKSIAGSAALGAGLAAAAAGTLPAFLTTTTKGAVGSAVGSGIGYGTGTLLGSEGEGREMLTDIGGFLGAMYGPKVKMPTRTKASLPVEITSTDAPKFTENPIYSTAKTTPTTYSIETEVPSFAGEVRSDAIIGNGTILAPPKVDSPVFNTRYTGRTQQLGPFESIPNYSRARPSAINYTVETQVPTFNGRAKVNYFSPQQAKVFNAYEVEYPPIYEVPTPEAAPAKQIYTVSPEYAKMADAEGWARLPTAEEIAANERYAPTPEILVPKPAAPKTQGSYGGISYEMPSFSKANQQNFFWRSVVPAEEGTKTTYTPGARDPFGRTWEFTGERKTVYPTLGTGGNRIFSWSNLNPNSSYRGVGNSIYSNNLFEEPSIPVLNVEPPANIGISEGIPMNIVEQLLNGTYRGKPGGYLSRGYKVTSLKGNTLYHSNLDPNSTVIHISKPGSGGLFTDYKFLKYGGKIKYFN